ncbi:unnamed protein product [Camellia sinensis]
MPSGQIKLNTDGCVRGDRGNGGFGGLFRDDSGIWIYGYFGKLEVCSSLEAELWGIYRGLTVIFKKGYIDVLIESDSVEAVDLLQNATVVNASFRSIVEDARHLLKRCRCSIQHILREGNQCADKLAKLGADQEEHLVVMEDPPEEVQSLVVADLLGREYQRL